MVTISHTEKGGQQWGVQFLTPCVENPEGFTEK